MGTASTSTPVSDRPTLEGFDPLSQEFLANPYPTWERARRECPVFFFPDLNYWVVTRYEDIVGPATDWRALSQRAAALAPVPEELRGRITADWFNEAFMCSDPPTHTVARKIANKAFTRPRIAMLEPSIEARAEALIDAMLERGSADLMRDFAYPLSIQTIVQILGLPIEDAGRFQKWGETLLLLVSPRASETDDGYAGPVKKIPHEELVALWESLAEAREYFADVVDDRAANPREDFPSTLVNATDPDGEPALPRSRVITHMIDLITAGTGPTANLLGQMALLFEQNPEQLATVRREPELWDNAIDEGIRRRSVNLGMFRYATRDIELGDVTIPGGSMVFVAHSAAGHDEAKFGCPMHYDPRRENADDHLGFGRGRHFCLGAPLARAQARIALSALYSRIPDLRVAPGVEPVYRPSLLSVIVESLPVVGTGLRQGNGA